jgi:hypothetical protein
VGFLAIIFVMVSCNKYADKVDGTYIGQLTINDSIVSANTNIIISEISNKVISIESSFLTTYELEIERQRYFGSVTYFNQDNPTTSLEIGETATGFFLIFTHNDNLNNNYVFVGESD